MSALGVFLKRLLYFAFIGVVFFPVNSEASYCSGKRLQEILGLSGQNKKVLEQFLSSYKDSTKKEAACFLVAGLPLSDALTLNKEALCENLDYAFLARRLMPWGKEVPWDIFLHYVLPFRVSQEPAERWRKYLFEKLASSVNRLSIKQAILFITKWCYRRAIYRPSSPWDLGTLEIIKLGWGRCEEKAILLIDALRSVSIPARLAFVPAWQHTDGNHAWVEVWIDGKWHIIDPATPQVSLDNPWFKPDFDLMPIVLVPVYGKRQNQAIIPELFINNIKMYNRHTNKLVIQLKDKNGKPLSHKKIYLSVYNHASLRPIVCLKTNSQGITRVRVGYGTYLLSAQDKDKWGIKLVSCLQGLAQKIILTLTDKPLKKQVFLFRYPLLKANRQSSTSFKELDKERKGEIERRKRLLLEALRQLGLEDNHLLFTKLLAAGSDASSFLKILQKADADKRSWSIRDICQMSEKDIAECNPDKLYDSVILALEMRKKRALQGLNYPDEIFLKYVLNPRIFFEPWSNWRLEIKALLNSHFEDIPPRLFIKRLTEILNGLKKLKHIYFGPILTPGMVLRGRLITSDAEALIAAVAILRTFGIAARYQPSFGYVEVNLGNGWELLKNSFTHFDKMVSLKLSLRQINQKCHISPLIYGRDFTLAVFKNGHFQSFKYISGRWNSGHCYWEIRNIPYNQYYLIYGNRLGPDRAKVAVIPIKTPEVRQSNFHREVKVLFRD